MDETQYYVDGSGNYIGGFCGESALELVPDGAIEVPFAPDFAWYIWDGSTYNPPPDPGE